MDELFMEEAYKEAKKAYDINEVPIGAVIVYEGEIISRGFNKKETTNNPLAHGEIEAIKKAANKLNKWRLQGCTLYVTLEPCSMCTGAIINSRVDRVVIGARDDKRGCCGSKINLLTHGSSNHLPEVEIGVLGNQCSSLLSDFFKKLRILKKEKNS